MNFIKSIYRYRHIRNVRSFTLMELLAVIAIIALLAGLVMPAAVKARKRASMAKAAGELSGISKAEIMVEADIGYFIGLEFLDNTGTGAASATDDVNNTVLPANDANGVAITVSSSDWNGPYTFFKAMGANRRPLDPWGNQYELDITTTPYRIRSLGPDRDDDSWTEYNGSTGDGDVVYKFQ